MDCYLCGSPTDIKASIDSGPVEPVCGGCVHRLTGWTAVTGPPGGPSPFEGALPVGPGGHLVLSNPNMN